MRLGSNLVFLVWVDFESIDTWFNKLIAQRKATLDEEFQLSSVQDG